MDEESNEFKILKLESDMFRIQLEATNLELAKKMKVNELNQKLKIYNEIKKLQKENEKLEKIEKVKEKISVEGEK